MLSLSLVLSLVFSLYTIPFLPLSLYSLSLWMYACIYLAAHDDGVLGELKRDGHPHTCMHIWQVSHREAHSLSRSLSLYFSLCLLSLYACM